jgi:hypothetical protein
MHPLYDFIRQGANDHLSLRERVLAGCRVCWNKPAWSGPHPRAVTAPGSLMAELTASFREGVIRIAVQPALSRLCGRDHGWPVVCACMVACRFGESSQHNCAAARLTRPQMDPRRTDLHALLAFHEFRVSQGRDRFDMRTSSQSHRRLGFLSRPVPVMSSLERELPFLRKHPINASPSRISTVPSFPRAVGTGLYQPARARSRGTTKHGR